MIIEINCMKNTGKEKIQNKITFIDNIYVTNIKRNATKIKENCDNKKKHFLCKIGIHKWRYVFENYIFPFTNYKVCQRCGKHKVI